MKSHSFAILRGSTKIKFHFRWMNACLQTISRVHMNHIQLHVVLSQIFATFKIINAYSQLIRWYFSYTNMCDCPIKLWHIDRDIYGMRTFCLCYTRPNRYRKLSSHMYSIKKLYYILFSIEFELISIGTSVNEVKSEIQSLWREII